MALAPVPRSRHLAGFGSMTGPPISAWGVGLSAKPGQARESCVLRTVFFPPPPPVGEWGKKERKVSGGRGLALSSGRAADLPFSVPHWR
jgi:hypothetical protein